MEASLMATHFLLKTKEVSVWIKKYFSLCSDLEKKN